MSILVVGALHWDVLVDAPHLPRRDETVTGTGVSYAFGGKGGNQALAAAQHGAAVAMAGRVGDDGPAERMLAELRAAGVDAAQVQRGEGPSGTSVAIVDAEGNYGAVIVSAANSAIKARAIRLPPECKLVLLQNEIPEPVNLSIARAARAVGVPVVLNAAPARAMSEEMLETVNILVVNRVEAAQMTALGVDTLDEAKAAAERLSDGRSVIVTLGADGLVICDGGLAEHRPGHEVDVVSTHGAGDAFVGALAARLVAGEPLGSAAEYAQAAAALHVARPVEARRDITPADVLAVLGW